METMASVQPKAFTNATLVPVEQTEYTDAVSGADVYLSVGNCGGDEFISSAEMVATVRAIADWHNSLFSSLQQVFGKAPELLVLSPRVVQRLNTSWN